MLSYYLKAEIKNKYEETQKPFSSFQLETLNTWQQSSDFQVMPNCSIMKHRLSRESLLKLSELSIILVNLKAKLSNHCQLLNLQLHYRTMNSEYESTVREQSPGSGMAHATCLSGTRMLVFLFIGLQIHIFVVFIAPLVTAGSVRRWRTDSSLVGINIGVNKGLKKDFHDLETILKLCYLYD